MPNHELPPPTPTLDALLFDPINFVTDPMTITPTLARVLFRAWFHALPFESIMPTKPLVLAQGPKGSGKTSLLCAVGQIYYGPAFQAYALPDDEKDFDTVCYGRSYIVLDNLDDTKGIKWLENKLAMIATGGSAPRRALYTDHDTVETPFRCFLGMTARTPRFTRDDVADRLLIFTLERLERWTGEGQRRSALIEARPAIWRELLAYNQWILRALAAYPMGQLATAPFSVRMADFADFAWRLALYAGPEAAEQCAAAFKATQREQAIFTLQANPLMEYLNLWLSVEENRMRSISSSTLCDELLALVPERKNIYIFTNHHAFSREMVKQLPALHEFYYVVETSKAGNVKHYSIAPRDELPVTDPERPDETDLPLE
jgi:hypothetical protein